MILFLDDNPNRAANVYRRMNKKQRESTIWCQTVEETICTLKDYSYRLEVVMLDHDLNGEMYVNTAREDCGMEVVRYLERLSRDEEVKFKDFEKTEFIIHTYNRYAGMRMAQRLQKLGLKSRYQPLEDE